MLPHPENTSPLKKWQPLLLTLLGAGLLMGHNLWVGFSWLTALRAAVGVTVLALLWGGRAAKPRLFYQTLLFYVIYVAWTVVATLIWPQELSTSQLANFLTIPVVLAALLWLLAEDLAQGLRWIYYICVGYLLLMCCLSGWEMVTTAHLSSSSYWGEAGIRTPTALYHNENDLAALTTLAALYAFAYCRTFRPRSRRWTGWCLLAAAALLSLATGCKICLLAIMLQALWALRGFWKRHWLLLAALAAVGAAAGWTFYSGDNSSIHTRLNIYKYLLQSAYDSYGLGFGINGDQYCLSAVDNYYETKIYVNAHNHWLQFLATSGVPVFLLFTLLIARLAKNSIHVGNGEFTPLPLLYLVALTAPSTSIMLWGQYLFLGAMAAVAALASSDAAHAPTERRLARICHVTSVHPANDIRVFYKECCSAAKRYDTCLIAPNVENYEECGVRVVGVRLPDSRLKRPFFLGRVRRAALAVDADIYHFHDPELIPIGRQIRRHGKRVVFDSHEDVPMQLLTKEYLPEIVKRPLSALYAVWERIGLRHYDALVTVTPSILDRLKLINPQSVMVTNYPVLSESSPAAAPKSDPPCVVFAGGVDVRYMHEYIIKSLPQTRARYLLAGRCFFDSYMSRLKALDAWERVDYLGELSPTAVGELYAKAAAGLVLLDYSPNVGYHKGSLGVLKMFEYMMAGIPVIATDFDLWKEIIEGNDCGICIDPHNVQAIADAINYFVENPEIARQKGANGREAVCRLYNWSTQETVLLNLYDTLLQK